MRLIRLKKTTQRKEWGCPRTKNRSNWCHAWCSPKGGVGDCGRLAPHGILGRTQEAILSFKIDQQDESSPPRAGRPLSRRKRRRVRVTNLLQRRDRPGLRALVRREPNVHSTLVACLSELDDVVRWRAVEALGWLAADLAREEPEKVTDLVRRLFWSMNDECGGTAWHAPEAIGEVLASVPELAPDFTSVLASHQELDPFQVGVIWSLRRLATVRPDLVRAEEDVLLSAARSPLAQKRGQAAAALGLLDLPVGRQVLQELCEDEAEVSDYDRVRGKMRETTVGELARKSIEQRASIRRMQRETA